MMGNVHGSLGSSHPTLKEITKGFLEEAASLLQPVVQEANNPGAGEKKKGVIKTAQWRWRGDHYIQ